MATTNEKYIKGFNDGYLLKEHNPDLLKSILQSKSDNDYFKGLSDGSKVLKKEKIKTRLQELKKNTIPKDIER